MRCICLHEGYDHVVPDPGHEMMGCSVCGCQSYSPQLSIDVTRITAFVSIAALVLLGAVILNLFMSAYRR